MLLIQPPFLLLRRSLTHVYVYRRCIGVRVVRDVGSGYIWREIPQEYLCWRITLNSYFCESSTRTVIPGYLINTPKIAKSNINMQSSKARLAQFIGAVKLEHIPKSWQPGLLAFVDAQEEKVSGCNVLIETSIANPQPRTRESRRSRLGI